MDHSTLDPKLAAFVRLKIDVSATHLYAPGVRRHIKTAIELGATREELLEVIKLSAVIGIHSCATGVPILAQEHVHAGRQSAPPESTHPTPVCDGLRAQNQFNPLVSCGGAEAGEAMHSSDLESFSAGWAHICARTCSTAASVERTRVDPWW